MLIADDLDKLVDVLPGFICESLKKHPKRKFLIEVVMDLGRKPEARFPDGPCYLSSKIISWYHLDYCIRRIGNFSGDNRAGIERTLHRISSLKNRKGNIVGLTCRVGRAIFGTINIVRDLLEKQESILLLGRPGVGKTTVIREIARILADEMQKRVVIIDTSNEIAGDGDIPHPAIGRARRMQVAQPEFQHQVMIEAVENHMPEVIIIDEIGTELEALAARTITERGVQLVGTAHGNDLQSLINNPILCDLIGGVQSVTLGDDEAKRRGSQKSILERKAAPAFQMAIEMHSRDNCIVHEEVDYAVDQILQGSILFIQRRKLNKLKHLSIECESYLSSNFNITHNNLKLKENRYFAQINKTDTSLTENLFVSKQNMSSIIEFQNSNINTDSIPVVTKIYHSFTNKDILLYPYSLNINQLESILQMLALPLQITRNIVNADIILAVRANVKQNMKLRQIAKKKHITIYTIHSNSNSNIIRALKQIVNTKQLSKINWRFLLIQGKLLEIKALLEVKRAINSIVIPKKQSVQLLFRVAYVRQLQHQFIESYNLRSRSFGEEPYRMLRIYPH
uniref:Conserved hypothetical plastid protein n=1 Tax=Gastroclonium compressum TaxID=1852973 RepID=A0A173G040_GASCM|nr:conserved hypothetical plastid protein [Coeloseira compressa]ANH09645.1 conserved hypothetical plastid protein [Coeloseira compressa]